MTSLIVTRALVFVFASIMSAVFIIDWVKNNIPFNKSKCKSNFDKKVEFYLTLIICIAWGVFYLMYQI